MSNERPVVVYVHGLGPKPAPSVLKRNWDRALFQTDMGDRTRLAYWADILHPEEAEATDPDGLRSEMASMPSLAPHAQRFRGKVASAKRVVVETILPEMSDDREQREFAEAIVAKFGDRAEHVAQELEPSTQRRRGTVGAAGMRAKILPLPDVIRQPLARAFLRQFVKDAYEYIFNKPVREAIQQRLLSILTTVDRPIVLIGHSLGSVIAYDVLRRLEKGDDERLAGSILRFVTVGSPLGIDEIKSNLAKPRNMPRNAPRWGNFADRLDIVALDLALKDDFAKTPANKRRVEDEEVENPERNLSSLTSPHSITGYLATPKLRNFVWEPLPTDFASTVASFTVARDVAAGMADARITQKVLIELSDTRGAGSLTDLHARLEKFLVELGKQRPKDMPLVAEHLTRYVSAALAAPEIEAVAAKFGSMKLARVWKNGRKRALISQGARAVQVAPARLTYEALGAGITWAVLDTGIVAKHPHFENTKLALFDATLGSPLPAPSTYDPKQKQTVAVDGEGHGTHVAGIIAGAHMFNKAPIAGMATAANLHIYKVLDDDGAGEDAWIIKALDHIHSLNERSSELVVHGVNLSLGGPFDAETFACGHSPICRELRRLWQQGVVVCVAAGNEGVIQVTSSDGPVDLSLDLSIGDPANLEEAIAVGSVHKSSPTIFGISYFSSRGPTADGRSKPDVVAPGERILSCNFEYNKRGADPYIELSGTSMACPHVSGLIAAFLSARREYIGYPDKVKQILLRHARDIGRDRYHQGAGIPNLMAMLVNA